MKITLETRVFDVVLHIHVSQSFLSGLVTTLKIIKGHGYSSKKQLAVSEHLVLNRESKGKMKASVSTSQEVTYASSEALCRYLLLNTLFAWTKFSRPLKKAR